MQAFGKRVMSLSNLNFTLFEQKNYENKVLLLMSVRARLEIFGEKDLVFIKCRSCKNVLKTNGLYVNQSLDPNM